MAIPRNIKGVNPAQIKKNGSYMSEHQNAFLQSDEDLSLPDLDDEIEELPDLDDVFQTDESHPEKASVFDEVKNLDEDELDKLLGIDDLDDNQSEHISFENNENDKTEEENEKLPEIEIDLNNPVDSEDDLTTDIDSDDDFIVEEDSELIFTDEDDNDSSPTDLSDDDIDDEDLLLIDDEDAEDEDSEDFEFVFEVDDSDEDDETNIDGEDLFLIDDEDPEDEDSETDSEIESILFEDDDSLDSEEDENEEFVFEINDEIDEEDDEDDDSFVFFEDDEDNDESDDEEIFVFEDLDDEDENSNNDEAFMNLDEDDEYIPDESEILPVQSLSKKKQKAKNADDKEENNDDDIKKSSDDDKNNNNFLNNLLNRLKLMKEQISADLKGDEIPEALTDKDEEDDEEQETEDSNDENNSNKKGKKRAASKVGNPFKKLFQLKIFSPIIKLYKMVVNVCFGILNFVLGILSKLPIVGKFLKPVLAASKTLQKIATFMPIILVILILVLFNIFSVPRNYESTDLPDGAALTISDFSYDGETASATVANTGEIILDNIEIEFEIYSMQPNVNPKTWIIPQTSSKCSTQVEIIDIEGEVEISASCGFEKGKFPRATAHLKQ